MASNRVTFGVQRREQGMCAKSVRKRGDGMAGDAFPHRLNLSLISRQMTISHAERAAQQPLLPTPMRRRRRRLIARARASAHAASSTMSKFTAGKC